MKRKSLILSAVRLLILCALFTGATSIYAQAEPGKVQEFQFTTKDGWRIFANVTFAEKKKRPLLIAIHGLGGDRYAYPVKPPMKAKYNVLKLDMRGHGQSTSYKGKYTEWQTYRGNVFYGTKYDLLGALKHLEKNFPDYIDLDKIYMQGASYSCVAILKFLPGYYKKVRGIILLSGGTTWHNNYTNEWAKFLKSRHYKPSMVVCYDADSFCAKHMKNFARLYKNRRKWMQKRKSLTGAFFKAHATEIIMETGHYSHGNGVFYTDPDMYPGKIIKWMDKIEALYKSGGAAAPQKVNK